MDAKSRARALIAEAVPLLEPLLTTVSVSVMVVDVQGDDQPIRYVNPAFEAMTGYDAAEVLGRAAIASGRSETTTVLNYRRDGTGFFNEVRLAPIPGPNGDVRYYLGLLADVSPRVQAEQRLASAQALHSSVFNVVAEGILVMRANGQIIDVNPAALGILGLDRAQLGHPDWWDSLDAHLEDGDPVSIATSPGNQAVTERRSRHG